MKEGAKKKGRRSKSYSQAERLSRMMRALASRGMTIRDMAEEFAIKRRQVYRDLARIQEEGHPLRQSQDIGERSWQLPLNYKGLPPITLSPYELMSLHLAKSHLAFLKGTPFWEDLESVIAKVEAGLPVRTTNHLERIVQALATLARPVRNYSKKKAMLLNLRKALLLQRQTRLLYNKPDEQKPDSYVVDPYALMLYQSGLVVPHLRFGQVE
jgi:proteasome accessory factor B